MNEKKLMVFSFILGAIPLFLIGSHTDFDITAHWPVIIILAPIMFISVYGAFGLVSGWK